MIDADYYIEYKLKGKELATIFLDGISQYYDALEQGIPRIYQKSKSYNQPIEQATLYGPDKSELLIRDNSLTEFIKLVLDKNERAEIENIINNCKPPQINTWPEF